MARTVCATALTSNWTELGILHAGAIACVGMIAACTVHVAQESAAGIGYSEHASAVARSIHQPAHYTAQARYLAEDGRVDGVTDVLPQRRKGVQARHLPREAARSATHGNLSTSTSSTRSQLLLTTPGAAP